MTTYCLGAGRATRTDTLATQVLCGRPLERGAIRPWVWSGHSSILRQSRLEEEVSG